MESQNTLLFGTIITLIAVKYCICMMNLKTYYIDSSEILYLYDEPENILY